MEQQAVSKSDDGLKAELIATCRALAQRNLTYGTSGNASVRRDATSFFVSPTGVPYEALTDVSLMTLDGRWFGKLVPSSEWRFHRDILKVRPEIDRAQARTREL